MSIDIVYRKYPTWIESEDSFFNIKVLDCRPTTQVVVLGSLNADIALRFLDLRQSQGQDLRAANFKGFSMFTCKLRYLTKVVLQEGAIFKAETMEDRWDIYHYDSTLFFTQSWTGELDFTARLDLIENEVIISKIFASPRMIFGDSIFAIQAVDFLFKSHILNKLSPHPLPPNEADDPTNLAWQSLLIFGRRAAFGSFEDTVKVEGFDQPREI